MAVHACISKESCHPRRLELPPCPRQSAVCTSFLCRVGLRAYHPFRHILNTDSFSRGPATTVTERQAHRTQQRATQKEHRTPPPSSHCCRLARRRHRLAHLHSFQVDVRKHFIREQRRERPSANKFQTHLRACNVLNARTGTPPRGKQARGGRDNLFLVSIFHKNTRDRRNRGTSYDNCK